MFRKKLNDVSELEEWNYHLSKVKFGTLRSLHNVCLGQLSSLQYRSQINTCLAASHILSDVSLYQKEQISANFVTYADLEAVDFQYLLCGLNDGGVAVYDVSTIKKGRVYAEAGIAMGGQRGGHRHAVECVQWYPTDTGLFATSNRDKAVKLWDTNRMKPVDQFKLDCCVLHHHMSPVATKHSLLSASGETGELILCDLRTGSSTHRMVAHEGAVQVSQWSPRNQNVLVSGGKDQAIKMWDVRSAKGCLIALDMDDAPISTKYSKKRVKRNPVAHKSRVTSLCFSSDGLWLFSFSYDGDLKLWNSSTGKNMTVPYGETYTELKRGLRMAVSCFTNPDLVFVPSKSRIIVYEMFSGKMVNVLEGHFSTVLGVLYNQASMNLYSFGSDRNFLTWKPQKLLECDLSDEEKEEEDFMLPVGNSLNPSNQQIIQDAWSSDED